MMTQTCLLSLDTKGSRRKGRMYVGLRSVAFCRPKAVDTDHHTVEQPSQRASSLLTTPISHIQHMVPQTEE